MAAKNDNDMKDFWKILELSGRIAVGGIAICAAPHVVGKIATAAKDSALDMLGNSGGGMEM